MAASVVAAGAARTWKTGAPGGSAAVGHVGTKFGRPDAWGGVAGVIVLVGARVVSGDIGAGRVGRLNVETDEGGTDDVCVFVLGGEVVLYRRRLLGVTGIVVVATVSTKGDGALTPKGGIGGRIRDRCWCWRCCIGGRGRKMFVKLSFDEIKTGIFSAQMGPVSAMPVSVVWPG